jgi:hypothetical protein
MRIVMPKLNGLIAWSYSPVFVLVFPLDANV